MKPDNEPLNLTVASAFFDFFFWTQNSYLLRYSNVFFMIPLAFSLQYSTRTPL